MNLFRVKLPAFSIYRFYRKKLPAMTKVWLVCIVLWVILAFVVFSPGFTFAPVGGIPAAVATLTVSDRAEVEAGVFRDSEPLFLPTQWNFGAEKKPVGLNLRETSFMPFGEILSQYNAIEVIRPKNAQEIPPAEKALGADAWALGRGFGVSGEPEDMHPRAVKTLVRILEADSGKVVFSGELEDIDCESERMLLVPSEFFCGIASGYGKPRVMTVVSCGDVERDRKIIESSAKIVNSLKLNAGVYRICVD